jgi:hypothetical protein
MTAVECLQIYQFYSGIVSRQKFDIFFSSSPIDVSPIGTFILQHLTRLGYTIWYDPSTGSDELTPSRENALTDGIDRSSVVIVFANAAYMRSVKCMFELKAANSRRPNPTPIITLAHDPDPASYASTLFMDLTQLRTTPFADISSLTESQYDTEKVPSGEHLFTLQRMLIPLMRLLNANGCTPTLNVMDRIAD